MTLADLSAVVCAQLDAEGVEPGNGQVSARVDGRTLRYYAALGLLDRPVGRRGRVAVYGGRHVAQAVAVKRLQAAGWPLADIQRRLVGMPTADLLAVRADEPPPVAAIPVPGGSEPEARRAFWAQPPAPPGPPRGQAAAVSVVAPVAAAAAAASAPLAAPGAAALTGATPVSRARAAGLPLAGVALPGGAVLLLPGGRAPSPAEAQALADAAGPLLAQAARLGLLPNLTDRRTEHEGETP